MTTEQGRSNPIPANPTNEPLESPLVVIGREFLSQEAVQLKVTSPGGKDFKITDGNGTLIFQVKGKSFSIHRRCSLTDAAGNKTLVSYKKKVMTMHHRMEVFTGESQDEEHLLLRAKKSKMFQSNLDIYWAKNTVEEAPDFKIEASRKEGSFTIYHLNGESNTIIAKMQRSSAGRFSLTAYPNVDYAFIVALVVLVFLYEIEAEPSSIGPRVIKSISKEIMAAVIATGISVGVAEYMEGDDSETQNDDGNEDRDDSQTRN